MRDPYTVLGVPRSASEADIKKAFRKLAKQHHPDRASGDAKSKEMFAQANTAYEILGDKDKRAKFDRGEIDAEGKPKFAGFEGFGGGQGFDPRAGEAFGFGRGAPFGASGSADAEDLLREMFGGRRGRREPEKQNISADVTIPLEDAVRGGPRRLRLPNGREVEVTIPAGIAEGKTIRLKGQGDSFPFGSPPGDLLLTIRFAPHPKFTADGTNLRLRVPLPLQTAVLGGALRVDTLDGPVDLNVPPMTSGGRTFRLRGKGAPGAAGRGDLMVTVDVALPEGGDPELEALMRKRAAARG